MPAGTVSSIARVSALMAATPFGTKCSLAGTFLLGLQIPLYQITTGTGFVAFVAFGGR